MILIDIKMPDDLSITGQYCYLIILIYKLSNAQTSIEYLIVSNPDSSKKGTIYYWLIN